MHLGNQLLPVPEVLGALLLTRGEIVQLVASENALVLSGVDGVSNAARPLDIGGAFVALQASIAGSSGSTTVVRRLHSADLSRQLVRVDGGGEAHPLAAVLPGPPTAQQWREACRELAGRLLRGEAEHVTAAELRSVCERLAVLQRCAAELPAPGQPVDAARRKALERVLAACEMDARTWELWRQELGKWRWDAERHAQLAATGGPVKPRPVAACSIAGAVAALKNAAVNGVEAAVDSPAATAPPCPSLGAAAAGSGPGREAHSAGSGGVGPKRCRDGAGASDDDCDVGKEPAFKQYRCTADDKGKRDGRDAERPERGRSGELCSAGSSSPSSERCPSTSSTSTSTSRSSSSSSARSSSPSGSPARRSGPHWRHRERSRSASPRGRRGSPVYAAASRDWPSLEAWAVDVHRFLLSRPGHSVPWGDVASAGFDVPSKFRSPFQSLASFLRDPDFRTLWTVKDQGRLELLALPPPELAHGRGCAGPDRMEPDVEAWATSVHRYLMCRPGHTAVAVGLRDVGLGVRNEWLGPQCRTAAFFKSPALQDLWTVNNVGPLCLTAIPGALEPWLEEQRRARDPDWHRYQGERGRMRKEREVPEWKDEGQHEWASVEDWAEDVHRLLLSHPKHTATWSDVMLSGLDIPTKFRGTLSLTGFLYRFGHLWTLSDPHRPKDQPLELTATPREDRSGRSRDRSRAGRCRGGSSRASRSPPRRQEPRRQQTRAGSSDGPEEQEGADYNGGADGASVGAWAEGRLQHSGCWPTVETWSKDVHRYLLAQPGHTCNAAQLCSAGIDLPFHMRKHGDRMVEVLAKNPEWRGLWTISRASAAQASLVFTAIPGALEALQRRQLLQELEKAKEGAQRAAAQLLAAQCSAGVAAGSGTGGDTGGGGGLSFTLAPGAGALAMALVTAQRGNSFLAPLPVRGAATAAAVEYSGPALAVQGGTSTPQPNALTTAPLVGAAIARADAASVVGVSRPALAAAVVAAKDLSRQLVRVDGGSEVHPLAAVLPGPPTAQQWREACRELAGRLLRGEAEHVTAAELRSVCERLAVLQRCSSKLAEWGLLPASCRPTRVFLLPQQRQALAELLSGTAVKDDIWREWSAELQLWRWDDERARELARTGALAAPGSAAEQLRAWAPLESAGAEPSLRAAPEPVPAGAEAATGVVAARFQDHAGGRLLPGPGPPDWPSVGAWAEAVHRCLLQQPDHSMDIRELFRHGLQVPDHFRNGLGITNFLYRFPDLWSLSDRNRPKGEPLKLIAKLPPGPEPRGPRLSASPPPSPRAPPDPLEGRGRSSSPSSTPLREPEPAELNPLTVSAEDEAPSASQGGSEDRPGPPGAPQLPPSAPAGAAAGDVVRVWAEDVHRHLLSLPGQSVWVQDLRRVGLGLPNWFHEGLPASRFLSGAGFRPLWTVCPKAAGQPLRIKAVDHTPPPPREPLQAPGSTQGPDGAQDPGGARGPPGPQPQRRDWASVEAWAEEVYSAGLGVPPAFLTHSGFRKSVSGFLHRFRALWRTNLVAALAFPAPVVLAPGPWHKLMFKEGQPRNQDMNQFFALALASAGASGQIMANTNDKKAKKNTLKLMGAAWCTAAALKANNVRKGTMRPEAGLAAGGVQALMGATFLWAGFRKD
ncbi:hypothetical protein HYH03_004760 [Edaphochlamys debaryana]|uniref:Uncharacterized protein n=1 Tax=Edaphochlamys debaryana TaxID=47281 RepID=A0A836C1Q3_9CHLO|nr:hypothetical protein HYH03_004760 [Edaphochlamys debaryana]|eukprot:KAG2497171.1 hypothetical protein HYH03_004760 [Edaphochlamys debaryana]